MAGGKGHLLQAWQHALHPQSAHKGRRRETTPKMNPLTTVWVLWHVQHTSHTQTHMINKFVNCKFFFV